MKFRTQRYPTRYDISLEADGLRFSAVILSISASGAGLRTVRELPVGQKVALVCTGLRLTGTVRWSGPAKTGIAFDRILTTSELDRMRFGIRTAQRVRSHSHGFAELR